MLNVSANYTKHPGNLSASNQQLLRRSGVLAARLTRTVDRRTPEFASANQGRTDSHDKEGNPYLRR